MLSNPLTELIPAQYRRYVYLVAAAALFIYGLWEVSAGDIKSFLVALGSALVSGLAASNVSDNTDDEDEGDDGLTYAESGGLPFPSDYDESALYGDGAERGYTPDDPAGDPNRI